MTKEQLEKISEKLCGVEIDKYEFQDFIVGEFETENRVLVEKSGSNYSNFIAYDETDDKYIELEVQINDEEETIKIVEAYIKNFRS
ncbi:hypothetical protein [Fusobacterium gastrosuis]|uniref:hypothetical protein n=1 Tax=Fusobacterium gastrosuis TaxID=1755100 RepID=UPI002AA0A7A4|nr:hypothetical protein [Fusobacterium gastrosuis]